MLPIAEIIIFGTIEAAVYALIALGFSLVYGVGGILNLSHGAFYLLSAYIIYWTYDEINNTFIGMILALIIITIVGGITYLLIIRPLQENLVAILIITFSLAFFFEQFIRVFGDALPHSVPRTIKGIFTFLGVSFPRQFLLILIGAFIVVVLTGIFINKSKLGKSIRAISQDREAAMLMGINADRILMYTVMISALLAGIAAVLYLPASAIAPYNGWDFLTKSFAIVIFGGLGSLKGSVVGAFILGYTSSFVNYIIDPAYSSIVPIVVIILVLVIRPRGIFGKKEIY
jgi:branched-chain amino acid transport system permease protein